MRRFLRTIFLVDLLEGLWVTFRYQPPKNIVTEQYPLERPKVAERYRGAPRLNNNPETSNCIASQRAAGRCKAAGKTGKSPPVAGFNPAGCPRRGRQAVRGTGKPVTAQPETAGKTRR